MEDFTFTLYQSAGSEDAAAPKDGVASVTVSTANLTASVKQLVDTHGCIKEAINHLWTVRLDPILGLPEAVDGTVSCEIEVTVDKKDKDSVVDSMKGMFGFGKKGDKDQQPLKEDGKGSSSSASSSSTSSSSGKASKSTDSAKDAAASAKPEPPKIVKKTVTVKIAFDARDTQNRAVPAAEIKRMKERLVSFDTSDTNRRSREEDLNNLESFTYKVRDYLSNEDFLSYLPAPLAKTLETLQQQTSDWLGEESRTALSETLKEKLKALKDIIDPALKRQSEAAQRPSSIQTFQQALNQTRDMLKVIKEAIAENEKREAEASASSLAEAAKAAESAAASPSAADADAEAFPSPSSSSDPLADLEEEAEPLSSSSITAAPKASETPATGETMFTPYTSTDLSDLDSAYESVTAWLEGKFEAQDKLSAHDDPIFDVKELSAKAEQLNSVLVSIFQRRMKFPSGGGSSGGGKKSRSKSKSKTRGRGKKATTSGSTASSSETTVPVASEEAKSVRDEL